MMWTVALIPFGYPAAIWYAAIAVPVIAAFFFRFRSRIQEIPALSHWLQIGRPADIRNLGAWIRRLISLAVQLLVVAILVFALADPNPAHSSMHRMAVVVDVSSTMQTKENGTTRLSLALEKARDVLRSLPPHADVYMVTAADRPVSLRSNAVDPGTAIELLGTIQPTDTDADIPSAIRAVSFLANDPTAQVVVISDFAGTSPPSALSTLWNGPANLALISVGDDHPDAAITGVGAQVDPKGWKIQATFTSRGMGGRIATAKVLSGGAPIAQATVALNDGVSQADFVVGLPAGSAYEVALDSGDALGVDDHAFGILPSRRASVCLVTRGDLPLERALLADPTVGLQIVQPDQYNGPGDATVVIFDGPGLSQLAPDSTRGYLFIGTPDPFGFTSAGQAIAIPGVTHWRGDHAILDELDPSRINFGVAQTLNPSVQGSLVPLLSSGEVPLIAEISAGVNRGKMVYWLFNLSDTDLPKRLSFPVLLWNTVDYLSDQQDDQPLHITGHPLSIASGQAPVATGPDGSSLEVRAIGSRFSVRDTRKQGFYAVRADGRDEYFAVNLLSARGTLPLPRDVADKFALTGTSVVQPRAKLTWHFLLGIAMALLAVEWLLFHFRVIRIG